MWAAYSPQLAAMAAQLNEATQENRNLQYQLTVALNETRVGRAELLQAQRECDKLQVAYGTISNKYALAKGKVQELQNRIQVLDTQLRALQAAMAQPQGPSSTSADRPTQHSHAPSRGGNSINGQQVIVGLAPHPQPQTQAARQPSSTATPSYDPPNSQAPLATPIPIRAAVENRNLAVGPSILSNVSNQSSLRLMSLRGQGSHAYTSHSTLSNLANSRPMETFSGAPTAEYGSIELPHEVPGTMAFAEHSRRQIVKFVTRDDHIADVGKAVNALGETITMWYNKFCTFNGPIDMGIQKQDSEARWRILKACVVPLMDQDAERKVVSIMKNESIAKWFVVRIVWEFLLKRVMNTSILVGLVNDSHAAFVEGNNKLRNDYGLTPAMKGAIFRKRANKIADMLGHNAYAKFRANKLKGTLKDFRDILIPFLKPEASRTLAGAELGTIATQAWDLNVLMSSRSGLFILNMPGSGGSFQQSTMKPVGSREPPSALHNKKIVYGISPSVIYRDDSGGSIFTKMAAPARAVVDEQN